MSILILVSADIGLAPMTASAHASAAASFPTPISTAGVYITRYTITAADGDTTPSGYAFTFDPAQAVASPIDVALYGQQLGILDPDIELVDATGSTSPLAPSLGLAGAVSISVRGARGGTAITLWRHTNSRRA